MVGSQRFNFPALFYYFENIHWQIFRVQRVLIHDVSLSFD